MKKNLSLFLLLIFLTYGTSAADLTDTWSIEYRESGGILGKVQGLTLSAEGHGIIFDKRRGIKQAFTVSKQQLTLLSKEITRQTEAAGQNNINKRTLKRCADCITRQLTLHHKSGNLHYKGQMGIAGSHTYGVILNALSKVLRQGLANLTSQPAIQPMDKK